MSRLLVPAVAAEIRFPADRFAPTQNDSAAAKARFANRYVCFVATGFDCALFQPWFYQRLSMSFGHIAHRDLDGFYNTWFERTFDQYVFVERALRWRCFGDPAFTYCDVEAALQQWLSSGRVLDALAGLLAVEREARERAELHRLLAKYGVPAEFRRAGLPVVRRAPRRST
jgi:hypothetical protein